MLFRSEAGYGAFLGCMVIGIKRAVFSNEAGTGSASIAHSAAKTDVPIREGYVALLEPFIDTVVVCTMTALVIIITGVSGTATDKLVPISVENIRQELRIVDVDPSVDLATVDREQAQRLLLAAKPEMDRDGDAVLTINDMIQADRGAWFTKEAFVSGGHEWFRWFLYAAVVLFAYSTCISWYYYGERCCTSLLGDWSSFPFKVVFLTFTFLGAVIGTSSIKDFSDMMILGMAFPNMLGMYFLSGKVRGELRDYLLGLKSGKYPANQ